MARYRGRCTDGGSRDHDSLYGLLRCGDGDQYVCELSLTHMDDSRRCTDVAAVKNRDARGITDTRPDIFGLEWASTF